MLLLATLIDLTENKIPNLLVLFGLIFSVICQTLTQHGIGFYAWFIGVSAGFLCFFPLYLLKGMAAGDVKLMMAVGGFLGYPLVLKAAVITFIVGGVMAIFYLLYKSKLEFLYLSFKSQIASQVNNKNAESINLVKPNVKGLGRMPYAPAIAAGTLIALYL